MSLCLSFENSTGLVIRLTYTPAGITLPFKGGYQVFLFGMANWFDKVWVCCTVWTNCLARRCSWQPGQSWIVIGHRAYQPIRQASESICSSSVVDRAEVGHDKVCFFPSAQKDFCVQGGQMPERVGLGQRLKSPRRHACRN